MKLNPTAFHDLLLDIEAKSTFDNVVIYNMKRTDLCLINMEWIRFFYHIRQADYAGFFYWMIYTYQFIRNYYRLVSRST